jgi:TPR repeat protein
MSSIARSHYAQHAVHLLAAAFLASAASGCAGFVDAYGSQACAERSLRNHPHDQVSIDSVSYFQEMCAHSDATSCSTLGVAYEVGVVQSPNLRAAKAAYRVACDLKNQRGCANLGVLIANAAKTESDIAFARSLFEGACATGESSGCAALGRMLRDGTGVQADTARAVSLLQGACDAGESSACFDLAELYATASPNQALSLYARSCVAGSAPACSKLGTGVTRTASPALTERVASR